MMTEEERPMKSAAAEAPSAASKSPDVRSRVDAVLTAIKATYQHYRHEIGHLGILSNLPPAYRDLLGHVADRLNATFQNAGVRLTPEDLCLVTAASMILPLLVVSARRTYTFQMAAEIYFAFLYPTMVSLYDAESGDAKYAGSDLAGWVLLSLWTVLERTVLGVRGYEHLWYLVLKCGLVYGLFSPKLHGLEHLMRLVVRPHVLPALGLDGKKDGGDVTPKAKTAKKAAEEAPKARGVSDAAAKAPAVEESDADHDTKSSDESGFSFVDVSELDQGKEDHAAKTVTVDLHIDSITGDDWKLKDGKDLEGPYLVFDVVEKHAGEEVSYGAPGHSHGAGKTYRTPVGTSVEEEEEEQKAVAETEKAEAEVEASEPELAEEETEEEGKAEKKPQEEPEEKDEKGEDKTEDVSKETSAKEEEGGAGTKEEEKEEEKEDAEKEEGEATKGTEEKQEEEEPAKAKEEAEVQEEELSSETKTEEEKPSAEAKAKAPKIAASYAWPDTTLVVPIVMVKDAPPTMQQLLRVAAYDKRAIGSDAFFGVAYMPAPSEDKDATLMLKDGRAEGDDAEATGVGEVRMAVRCG